MTSEALLHTPFFYKRFTFPTAHQNLKKQRVFNRPIGRIVYAAVGARWQTRTLYDLLELSPDVGISDIKQAYRQMARKYHPDVCPSHQAEESTRRFIEIQQAYETLSDPRLRAIYDHAVAMGRGSATTGRMPWMSREVENQAPEWKSQWESQLSALRRRSDLKARKADSWSARVRREKGLGDVQEGDV